MRMKKGLVLIISALLVFGLLPNSVDASGKYASKDEVIYVNLDGYGKAKNMYTVNTFHVTKPGELVDYGNYKEVRNLTDLTVIEQRNNEVHFKAVEEEFYYQGELQNTPLPWDISISYLLDGKEVSPEELAGENGKLEIRISTSANEAVNPLFFEHFLLQISLTLDPTVFRDIQAPKGTEANEGKDKQVTFTVLPEQEEVLVVSANVTDLEMDPVEIAAIPANIAIEDPDITGMKGDINTLADAIKDVNDGVADLSDGVAELNSGAAELNKGSTEYLNGITELDQSSGELVDGSREVRNVLRQVSEAVQSGPDIDIPDLGGLKELPKEFRALAKEIREFSQGLKELDKAIANLPSGVENKDIEALYEQLDKNKMDTQVVDQLVASYRAGQAVKKISKQIPIDLAEITLGMAEMFEEVAGEIESGLSDFDFDQLDDLAALETGLTTLASEYNAFHKGLVDYTSGVHTVATSYQELDSGVGELASGTSSLKDGVNELHEGTKELRNETSDLPEEMQSQIEEFMEEYDFSNFEPASFVSDRNENIGVVQFVLQTESIEIEEAKTDEEVEEETKNLWDRFLDLFR